MPLCGRYARGGVHTRGSESLNRFPIIDDLRLALTEVDTSWLLDEREKTTGPLSELFVSMLGRFADTDIVRNYCQARWTDPRSSAQTKGAVVVAGYGSTDDADSPDQWKDQLLTFVVEYWDVFKEVCSDQADDDGFLLEQARMRCKDKTVSASRRWLICAELSPPVGPE